MKRILILSLSITAFLSPAQSEEKKTNWFGKALSVFQSSSSGNDTAGAFSSAEELAKALRETLSVAAERALTELSRKGGFADSERYRIPLPSAVESFRKPLSVINQEYRLDNLQATMNRAAEAGVAAAPGIVKETIQNVSLKDLNELWKGEEDAITRFLEKHSRDRLSENMLPLISKATDASGATRTYKDIQSALPQSGGGLFSKLQSFTGIGVSDFDLDQYVNEKTLDALYAAMAAEEKEIRENPLARSTDLLKKLFGSR